jgi:hypothetical protein
MPTYSDSDFIDPKKPPTGVASARATNPFARAGYAIEDLLVPKTETGQAIGLAGALFPFLKPLRYGAELPFVGRGLQAASEIGEAHLIPALARLGIMSGAGAAGAKMEGKSPVGGAIEGGGAGLIGEAISLPFNPKFYSDVWWNKFGQTATKILDQLPGFANDIRAGRNPIQALREIMPEANAVYGKEMEKIGQEFGGVRLFKLPGKVEPVSFEAYKAQIDRLGAKGWTPGKGVKGSDTARAAQAMRARLVRSLQSQLDKLSAQGNNLGNLPSIFGETQHPMPDVGKIFREANRQYEKVIVMKQFASNPDLIGRRRIHPEVAQRLVRDKLAPQLRTKLSPLEFLEFKNSVFMGSPHGVDQVSAPGVMSRPGGPSVYGGGSSLRGRAPIPGEEKPNISQMVGNLPMRAKITRLISELFGTTRAEKVAKNIQENQ